MPSHSLWLNLDRLNSQLLTAEDIGILTDADGTLAEIQDFPELASVPEDIASMLGRLNRLYKLVAVVSGRRAADVQALVGQVELLYLGNHGLERRRGVSTQKTPAGLQAYTAVADAGVELALRLPKAPGLFIENKGSVLAVHYRQCDDPAAIDAAKELTAELAAKFDLRAQHGRKVSEIRPLAADKGLAVLEVAREYGVKQIIYIGDDETDIDAFKALRAASDRHEISSVTIAVLGPESPPGLADNGDYVVESIDEVARFFSWLIDRAAF
ncbi:MAG: trehalose-phosphatase [Actinomycetota bacterium]|nr:trehalose-phosphatase [Actinomycetota bacterium]